MGNGKHGMRLAPQGSCKLSAMVGPSLKLEQEKGDGKFRVVFEKTGLKHKRADGFLHRLFLI
jgi:hypothetical protein